MNESPGELVLKPVVEQLGLLRTGAISALELAEAHIRQIERLNPQLNAFADFDAERLVKTAEDCGEILSADGGLEQVLRLVHEAIPPKLRETAYAVALEVAAADGLVKPEEIRFLEMLGDALELDTLTKAAIERGIRARNTTL